MEKILFLFDLDGVVFDTEGQYSLFWNAIGEKYKGDADFAIKIKGQTLPEIFYHHFADNEPLQRELVEGINNLERNMAYEYITGAKEFIEKWSKAGPSHHCAIGVGHVADKIEKVGRLLGIPTVRVC